MRKQRQERQKAGEISRKPRHAAFAFARHARVNARKRTDAAGSGSFNLTETDAVVLNANGSKVETVTILNADGSVKERTVTTTSADQMTVTVQRTLNGLTSITSTGALTIGGVTFTYGEGMA